MRKIGIWIAVLLLLGSLAGCSGKNQTPTGGVMVYHLNNAETKVEADTVYLHSATTQERIGELLADLEVVESSGKAPLDMGFSVTDWEVNGKNLTLEVSPEYAILSGTTEVLVRAAIVRTLLQLEGIEGIFFKMNGEPLQDSTGVLVGRMTKDTFIQNDGNEINTYELVKVKLYFTNEAADRLLAANREKHYSTNTPLERFVVEELISGPSGQVEGIYPTINPETKIINVMTTDGICYVNLDGSFLNVINNTSLDLAAHSIANSLLELSTINKVQIMVNGEVPELFQGVLFSKEQ